ncbi:MAG: Ger(x)C family spore germination protein [Oscillospiraceae bacterium]|jgi:spore germination protein KC|nr:Ger(x)C family spore germination protein [Oscillospiraceae bacterium]
MNNRRYLGSNSFIPHIKTILAAVLLLVLGFSGCSDYRGLDEISIVAGISVDISEENPDLLHVGFEIIRPPSGEEGAMGSVLAEAEGLTIKEAIQNANKLLYRDLYFGNTNLIVISEEIAQEKGIASILNGLLRDFNSRDTMQMIICREAAAKKLITPSEESDMVFSYELSKSLDRQELRSNSAKALGLFEIHNAMNSGSKCYAMPAFRFNEELEEPQPQIDGMAVFEGEKLKGYIEDEQAQYYMFASEKLAGGSFTMGSGKSLITQSIQKSKPKLSHSFEDGRLTLNIAVEVKSSISEAGAAAALNSASLAELEAKSAKELAGHIKSLAEQSRKATGADIWGFGTELAQTDPKLWKQINANWQKYYNQAVFNVEVRVSILNA